MAAAFSPVTDFESVVDGLTAVTLRPRSGADVPAEKCLRRAVTQKEAAASDGKYTTNDVVFHLSINEIATQPALGSSIIDDLGTWRILEVARQTLSARWRCICRNLAITADLCTLVTIQFATYAKGLSGAQEPTWATQQANVRAKVQLEGADRTVEHQAQHTPRLASIYFVDQVLLTTNHRIVGPDGAIYKVKSWEDADRIDALYKVNAEVTRWPLS